MVEFGKRLSDVLDHHCADYKSHCIDYGALKNIISENAASIEAGGVGDGNASLALVASFEDDPSELVSFSLQFRYSLDREIETAVLFVLEEQGRIALELDKLSIRRAKFADGVAEKDGTHVKKQASIRSLLDELRDLHDCYSAAAKSVLRFVSFVDLNVTAVRKILKKHDKKSGQKLSYSYLSAYTDEYVDSHLHQLYSEGGLSSLMTSLKRAFVELHQLELHLFVGSQTGGKNGHRLIKSVGAEGKNSHNHQQIQSGFSIGTEVDPLAAAHGEEVFVTSKREPMLRMIQLSRDKLRENTNYVDNVAAQALFFGDSDEEVISTSSEMTGSQRLSSLLNLLSTFLYMTNYYCCAPTVGSYLNILGSNKSMAGIAIGMTPNAALVATVLYGWWSNHSYKSALIFAATCSLLGNVAYAMALPYNSTSLIMIGRALNGFGSARSINRRFIADTFSKRDRTSAAAAFVTAGALGMACGPALAAILSGLSYPLDGKLWSLESAPGYIMIIPWAVYLIATIVFFEEPDRSHMFVETPKKPSSINLANGNGENTYLLADNQSASGELEPPPKKVTFLSNIPVMTTLWVYFILKLVLECLMSSCPTMTSHYFGWSSRESGCFLAFLGLLMFPANMVVARLSHRFEDRELIRASLGAISLSILGFAGYIPGIKYSMFQYMPFGVCIFISTNALEGPNMSLLSKSIPSSWAKGIFNTGFLATEAGTLARSVGDVWITLAERDMGVEGILDLIFVPLLVLCGASLLLVHRNYDRMIEEDDDKEQAVLEQVKKC